MRRFYFNIFFLFVLNFNSSLFAFGQKDSVYYMPHNEISLGINIAPLVPSPLLISQGFYYASFSYYNFTSHFSYKFLIKNKQYFIKLGAGFPGYIYHLYPAYLDDVQKELDFSSSISWGKNKFNNKKSSFYVNKELATSLKLFEWDEGYSKFSSYESEGTLYRIGGGISYGFLFKLSHAIDFSVEQSFYINYSYLNYNYTSSQTTIIFMDTLARQETTYKQGTEIKHFVDFNFYKFLTLNCTFKLYGKENDY